MKPTRALPAPAPLLAGVAGLIVISLCEGGILLHLLAGAIPASGALTLAVAAALKSAVVLALLIRLRRAAVPPPSAAPPSTAPPDTRPGGKDSVIQRYRQHWGLTDAECDVAIFAVKGMSNNEIAALRNCTLTTVKSQLGAVYQKSGLRSRYQLIAFVTDEVCADQPDGSAETLPAAGPARTIRPTPGRKRGWTIARLWTVQPLRMPRTRAAALRNLSR